MTDSHKAPSDTEIAALLDGRLGGEEKERLAARIADDPAAFAVFSEAMRFQLEDRPRTSSPMVWLRRPLTVAAAVAAGLLALLLMPRLYMSRAVAPEQLVRLAAPESVPAAIERASATLLEPGPRSFVTPRAESLRALHWGASAFDLEVLRQAGEVTPLGLAAGRLAADLRRIEGNALESAIRSLEEIEDDPAATRGNDLAQLVRQLMRVGGEAVFVGQWLRSAAMAAEEGQRSFFENRLTERAFAALDDLDLPAAAVADRLALEEAVEGVSASGDYAAVASALRRLAGRGIGG